MENQNDNNTIDVEAQVATVTPLVVYDVTKAQIAELRTKFSGLTFETTPKYEEGRKAIAMLRELRVKIENKRVELKAGALAYGRKVDSVAKELTAELEAIEEPLKLLKSAVDEEKERVKREAAEAERVALAEKIRAEEAVKAAAAKAERDAEESRLRAEREAEEKRLAAQRAELAAQQAELAEQKRQQDEATRLEGLRIAAERQRIADEQTEAQRKLDEAKAAEDKRQADARAAEEKRQADAKAAEEARQAEAQRARDEAAAAERKRLDAERAELERQQRELAEAKAKAEREEAARLAKIQAERDAAERAERDRAAVAARALADAEKLAARAADVEAAKTDLAIVEQEASEILTGHAVAMVSAALRSIGRSETAVAARAQAALLEPMRKLAGRLPALDDSVRRLGELDQQLATALADEARAAEQIAAVVLVEVGTPLDLTAARGAVVDAENAVGVARGNVAKAEQALARSRGVAAKLDSLLGERADVECEHADWTRMALDHGRAGMQSDEVDAAGPELTGYINGALRACVGTRWTMTVETQRLDTKGKNLVDKFTIMVFDNEKGTHKEVKEHSGGERTSLAEAIASGLTMLGCRRAGFDRPTLVRDESTNFLDAESAPLWVKMMRHVVEFTNADRLLFVSHNQDVVRLADATIEPPDQHVRRQDPQSSQAA